MDEGKCPICGKKLKRKYQDIIAGNVCEEREDCPEGHYSYEFHYGRTEYYIGDERFGWHYMDNPKHVRKIKDKIELAIEKMKLRQ